MRRIAAVLTLGLLAVLSACAARSTGEEISKERAVELARPHVTFEPGKVEAVKGTDEGRPVWRVTFYGKGVDATRPGEVMFVLLDRKTGEVVSLGMS